MPLTETNWEAGQPDNYRGKQSCLVIQPEVKLQWDDSTCTIRRNFICEKLTDGGDPDGNDIIG